MKFRHSKMAAAVALSLSAVLAHAQTAANREQQQMDTVLKAGGVLNAWTRGITGSGVTVGVIDQGFDLTHSDFAGSIKAAQNFYTPGKTVNWGQHGTQMASIVAGNKDGRGTVGVAPDAMLLLGQVGAGGTSGFISQQAVYAAIDWMSRQGVTAINMSFGYSYDTTFQRGVTRSATQAGVYFSPTAYGVNYGQNAADIQGYAVGAGRGSVLVAAAGNQGLAYSAFPGVYATRTDINGNLVMGGRMLIVGATSPDGKIMASFSNRAGHLCQNVVGTTCADRFQVKDFYVVAPGMQSYGAMPNSLVPGNTASAGNGTSQAAAYVTGGIALMKQAWPQLRGEQLVALTLNTATDLGAKGVDEVFGYGLVNFDKATAPQGNLTIASQHQKLGGGSTGSGKSVTSTGASTTSSVGTALGASSVLSRTQIVDGYGRNYSANFTRAINSYNAMTHQYASPWLALSPIGYQQVQNLVSPGMTMMVARTDTGVATQINWQSGANTYQFQVGAMQERDGFLGNRGSGAMSFGSSGTSFTMLGLERAVGSNTVILAQYGLGYTQVANAGDSMIAVTGPLVTDTWKLGLAQTDLLTNRDRLQLTFGSPVAVRSGSARVSAVTGYTYSGEDANGDVYATPVTESEKVSLRPPVREYNLALGYTAPVSKTSSISANLIQQFNVGGEAGRQGQVAGITYTNRF